MILVVSPFGPESGSGNWRTARRYADLLVSAGESVSIVVGDVTEEAVRSAEVALLLHARRSQASARALRAAKTPYAVVLTGTDLYGDLNAPASPNGLACLETLAGAALVVGLQADACDRIRQVWPSGRPPDCLAIAQTAAPSPKRSARSADPSSLLHRPLILLMAGHIRPEKDPLTAIEAVAQAFPVAGQAVLHHLGGCRDQGLSDQVTARVRQIADRGGPDIHLHGAVDHPSVLDWLDQADLLIHSSVIEGGSLVLSEAAAQGCPALVSRIPAHLAMLGEDYPAYFTPGDIAGAAELLRAFAEGQATRLAWQQAIEARRSLLCDVCAEQRALRSLVAQLRGAGGRQSSTRG